MSRYLRSFALCLLVAASVDPPAAPAAVTTTAVRETVEYLTKNFSKEVAEQGVETVTRKLEQLATKHGDEALAAVKRVGPQALKAVDGAGPQAATALRAMARHGDDGLVWIARRPEGLELAAKYGDDAADVLVKHKGIAESLVRESGESAVKALQSVGPRGAVDLAALAGTQATAALARDPRVLGVVARYGDNAMAFIWKHKGALTVSAALAAFLADPQPFIDGTRDLAEVVGENVVKPLVSIPGAVAESAARSIDWTVVVIAGLMLGALAAVWRSYWRQRAVRRPAVH